MPDLGERFIKGLFNVVVRALATGGDRDLPSVFRRKDQLCSR